MVGNRFCVGRSSSWVDSSPSPHPPLLSASLALASVLKVTRVTGSAKTLVGASSFSSSPSSQSRSRSLMWMDRGRGRRGGGGNEEPLRGGGQDDEVLGLTRNGGGGGIELGIGTDAAEGPSRVPDTPRSRHGATGLTVPGSLWFETIDRLRVDILVAYGPETTHNVRAG